MLWTPTSTRRSLVLGAVALSLGSVAQARETPTPAAAKIEQPETASGAHARRYCVVQPASTGTIISGKVCRTREDWLKHGFDPLTKR